MCASLGPFFQQKSLGPWTGSIQAYLNYEHVLSLTVVINDAPSTEGVAHHKVTRRIGYAHFGLQFRSRNYLLFMVSTGN